MSLKSDERLRHDHVELGDLLADLEAALLANDIARSHSTLDFFWARLAMHIRAEHLHLFPVILEATSRSQTSEAEALPPGEVRQTIEVLRKDHDFFMRELSRSVAITRGLLANPATDSAEPLGEVRQIIGEVKKRLARHNELEENGVYVWTGRLLTDAEQSALTAEVNKELENIPPRFPKITN